MVIILWDHYGEMNFLIYQIISLAFSRFLSFKQKFNNNPEFHTKYQKTKKNKRLPKEPD